MKKFCGSKVAVVKINNKKMIIFNNNNKIKMKT